MSYVIYGTRQTLITLYEVDGITPLAKITLQKETKEGLLLKFTPEGVKQKLGSGAGWRLRWSHRGFRPSVTIKWDVGLHSRRLSWVGEGNGTGGGPWGPAAEVLTAEALAEIENRGLLAPCLVQPHLDHAFTFWAQPDPGKAFELKDLKGCAHTGLGLELVGTGLAAIPDFVP